jgi:hypothetical protein
VNPFGVNHPFGYIFVLSGLRKRDIPAKNGPNQGTRQGKSLIDGADSPILADPAGSGT